MDRIGPGTLLAGRYRLAEQVAADPAAAATSTTLWRAEDLTLERPVGVRVIPADDLRMQLTLDAARRAALVDDTRLQRVLGVGVEGGSGYIVLEWITGQDARTLAGRVSEQEALRIVTAATEALRTAATRTLHHGRLGPRQLVRASDGTVRIVGTAVDVAAAGPATPAAAARPEPRDVRDLTAVLYALLTAHWPFGPLEGLPPAPTDKGHPTSARLLRADVSEAVDELLARTLGGRGAERLDDLVQQLHAVAAPPAAPARPAAPLTSVGDTDVLAPVRPAVSGAGTAGVPVVASAAAASAAAASAAVGPAAAGASSVGAAAGSGLAGAAAAGAAAAGSAAAGAAAAEGSAATGAATVGAAATGSAAVGAAAVGAATVGAATVGAATVGAATGASAVPAHTGAAEAAAATPPAASIDLRGPRERAGSVVGRAARAVRPASGAATRRATVVEDDGWDLLPVGDDDWYDQDPTSTGSGSSGGAPVEADDSWFHDDPRQPWDDGPAGGRSRPARGRQDPRVAPAVVPGTPRRRRPAGAGTGVAVVLLVGAVVVGSLVWALDQVRPPVAEVVAAEPSVTPSAAAVPPPPPPVAPPPAAEPGPELIAPAGAQAIDPQGDGEENDQDAPRAIDGDPASAWATQTYNSQDFGGLKDGIGLVLDLGSPRDVSAVRITAPGQGGTYEIRTAPGPGFDGSTVVGTGQTGDQPADVTPPAAVSSQYLVLWFTALPDDGGEWRAAVSEVQVQVQ